MALKDGDEDYLYLSVKALAIGLGIALTIIGISGIINIMGAIYVYYTLLQGL